MGKILFVYNSVSFQEKARNLVLGECASSVTVGSVYEALIKTGSEVIPLNLSNPGQLEQAAAARQADMAFVIAEGFLDTPQTFYDGSGAMMIREILNGQGIPYTHSSPETMKILRNKDCTHRTLAAAGIKVPSFQVIDSGMDLEARGAEIEENMAYPLFVKPAGGGCSICIDKHSVVHNRRELVERVRMVQMMLRNQPVLVETYLPGREYTVCVLGNHERYVLPVIGFASDAGVRSAAVKGALQYGGLEVELLPEMHPVTLSLTSLGAIVFEVLGTQDIIRLDVKEDDQGICHVIDVNGTPSVAAAGSVMRMAAAAGIQQQEMIALVLYEALVRENIALPSSLTEMIAEPLGKLQLLKSHKVA